MRIPNADYLERTGSANTLHQHIRAEEFYFVLEGNRALGFVLKQAFTPPALPSDGKVQCFFL
jgi:hypothetical protein